MSSLLLAIASSKFPLGDVVITTNALRQIAPADVAQAVSRHAQGDWGELCPEDRRENELALKRGGGRLMSVYRSGADRFWIITEADRSVTTVLLPLDY